MSKLDDIEEDIVSILVDPGVEPGIEREITALTILIRIMRDDAVYKVLHDNPGGSHRSISSYVIVIVAIMTGRDIFNDIGKVVEGDALQSMLASMGIKVIAFT